jgi:hypothetical protein
MAMNSIDVGRMWFDVQRTPRRRKRYGKSCSRRRSIGQLYRGSPPDLGKMGLAGLRDDFLAASSGI